MEGERGYKAAGRRIYFGSWVRYHLRSVVSLRLLILAIRFECSFAHRMRYTRSHLPILDVVSAAGVDMLTPLTTLVKDRGETFLGLPLVEELSWMERRKLDLTKLTSKGRIPAFWITALPGLSRLTSATEEENSEASDETLGDESGALVLLECRPLSIIWEEAEDEE
jgi:hypothetical protein